MSLRQHILLGCLSAVTLTGCASNPSAPTESAAAIEPPRPGLLFAAMIMTKAQQASSIPTDSGVLLHDPEARHWNRLGPAIQMISSAAADPSDPRTVFFACGNGIARSTDAGATWRLVTGWRESDALQIAIDPVDGRHVYAATAWGVTVSRDGGDTWQSANTGLGETFSRGIAIDHLQRDRLVLANSQGLYESNDRASTWERLESFPRVAVLRLRRSHADPRFWIAGTEGKGVWISRDDAHSWEPAAPALAAANVYGVAIDPYEADHLAAGGWDSGVHVSRDGGRTWRPAAPIPSLNITAMVFDDNTPHRLWASTFEEGTFYSDDHGQSWTTAHLDGAYVFDLGFLPAAVGNR